MFGIVLAVGVVVWKFSDVEPTYDEMRAKILSTSRELPRLCVTLYPNSIKKDFEPYPEVGKPLTLTPYIENGEFEKAAEHAAVGLKTSKRSRPLIGLSWLASRMVLNLAGLQPQWALWRLR